LLGFNFFFCFKLIILRNLGTQTKEEPILSNTVTQKDEKPYTAGQDDTSIPYIKIKITEIPLEKKLNTAIP